MLNLIGDGMQALLADRHANILYMGETFKERMQRMRKRAGFSSQQAAAKVIGCERGTVGMWEAPSSKVDSVGSEYLLDVAKAYRVRPESINDGSVDDGFPWSGTASQPATLDPAIVLDVASSMHDVFEELGHKFRGIQDAPELFVDIYQDVASGKVRPYLAAAKIGQWIERHQGKGSDGRAAPVPDSGTHSGKAGRRGKAHR